MSVQGVAPAQRTPTGAPTSTADAGGAYRPALDGLRAIAVAIVVAFHLGHLPGGILGVDAFFVVSGWLITWKLLTSIEQQGTIALGRFWSSRLRRLLPASLLLLLTVTVAWPLFDIAVSSLRSDVLWALIWASNWGTILGGGDYWARFGNPSPLNHLWSLAIEMQFYLAWPLVLWAVARATRHHRRAVAVISALVAAGSIVFMAMRFDPLSPTDTYMSTLARAHTLLIGALAAAVVRPSSGTPGRAGRAAHRLAPVAALGAVLIVAAASEQADWLFRWGFPTFALAMAVIVVAAADGMGARVLASPPMRWLGDRSYGLYLWHWPAILLLTPERVHVRGVALDTVRVLLSVALADVSLRVVETPVRRRRRLLGWRAPMAWAAVAAAVLVLAVTLVPASTSSGGAAVVTLPPVTTLLAAPGTTALPDPATTPVAAPATTSAAAGTPPTAAGGIDTVAAAPTTTVAIAVTTPLPAGPVRVLVAGDSTALHLGEALIDYAGDHPDEIVAGSAAFPGCGLTASDDGRLHEFTNDRGEPELLSLEGCLTQWRSIPERVASDEDIDVVLVDIGAWDAVDIHLPDGRVVSVADPAGRVLVTEAYRGFVDAVEAAGASVVWVTPPDTQLQWGAVGSAIDDPNRWEALRQILRALPVDQADLPGWLVEHDLTGPEGRPDGVHLTAEANATFVADVVAPTLVRVRQLRAPA